jgi:hypothetical protein
VVHACLRFYPVGCDAYRENKAGPALDGESEDIYIYICSIYNNNSNNNNIYGEYIYRDTIFIHLFYYVYNIIYIYTCIYIVHMYTYTYVHIDIYM